MFHQRKHKIHLILSKFYFWLVSSHLCHQKGLLKNIFCHKFCWQKLTPSHYDGQGTNIKWNDLIIQRYENNLLFWTYLQFKKSMCFAAVFYFNSHWFLNTDTSWIENSTLSLTRPQPLILTQPTSLSSGFCSDILNARWELMSPGVCGDDRQSNCNSYRWIHNTTLWNSRQWSFISQHIHS